MKARRQSKILELIQLYEIETQEELSALLQREGFPVTQATISRDIRELKLTKIAMDNGKQKYSAMQETDTGMTQKYVRVLKEGFVSVDMAQNIVVIHTVSGMASAVCAAVDAMDFKEMIGSIAGDDTIICVIRTEEAAMAVVQRLRKIVGNA